jgi:DNA-binding beta-propeller fold protein YncE
MTKATIILLTLVAGLAGAVAAQAYDVNGDPIGGIPPIPGSGQDDPVGTELSKFTPPQRVIGTTFVGDSVWGVYISSPSVLYEFDANTGKVLSSIQSQFAGPYGLGYDSRRNEFVLTAAGPGTIGRVDQTGKVTTVFPCPTTRPIGVAYDPGRDAYWVADWSANVLHLLDATTGKSVQPSFSLSPSGCTRSADVGYSPYNDLLCVIGRDKNQAFLFTAGASPQLRQAISFKTSVPGGARGSAFHPRTQTLWTSSYSSPYAVYEYDAGLPRVKAAPTIKVGGVLAITWVAASSPNMIYQAAASFTEGVRGYSFGSRYLPLALDPLFFLSVSNPAVFQGFSGVTDGAGTAKGAVLIPNAPALAGLFFSIGFVTVNPAAPQGIQDISGPWKVTLTKT